MNKGYWVEINHTYQVEDLGSIRGPVEIFPTWFFYSKKYYTTSYSILVLANLEV